jgi:CSLREA domain-containing protein
MTGVLAMPAGAHSASNRTLATFTLVFAGWLAVAGSAHAQIGSIILVTTTADTVAADGGCSLREAIIASNTNSIADFSTTGCAGTRTDSIRFALGSGTPQIQVLSALPEITAQVTISGNTGGATRVELRGPGSGGFSGLVVKANGTTVRGLVINNFNGSGIVIQTTSVTVTNCLIGTAADGVSPLPNHWGVYIDGPPAPTNHLIGGIGAGQPNVIAFNRFNGVLVYRATGNVIRGNSIHDNSGPGIDNQTSGNGEIPPPVITEADVGISGSSSCASCTIDVYADSWNQGEVYLGSTTTAPDGSWVLSAPAPGPNVTATVTDASGNTSEFSRHRRCPDFDDDDFCDGVDDSDLDGVADALDNCMLAENDPAPPDAGGNSQLDGDGDDYGNLCDGDLNNTDFVNSADLALFRAAFGTASPVTDLNGSGIVNAADLALFRSSFGREPGPSGLHRVSCTPGAPDCGWQTGDLVTWNQSAYGDGTTTAGSLLAATFDTVYISDLVIGDTITAHFTSAGAVYNFLPQGGASGPLSQNVSNPTITPAGEFAGHMVALTINIDFSNAGQLPSTMPLEGLYICGYDDVLAVNGMTIGQFFDLANFILGGGAGAPIDAELASLVAFQLNNAFLAGNPSTFAQNNLRVGGCGSEE